MSLTGMASHTLLILTVELRNLVENTRSAETNFNDGWTKTDTKFLECRAMACRIDDTTVITIISHLLKDHEPCLGDKVLSGGTQTQLL